MEWPIQMGMPTILFLIKTAYLELHHCQRKICMYFYMYVCMHSISMKIEVKRVGRLLRR